MKLVHFTDSHVQLGAPGEKQFCVQPLWRGDIRELFKRLSAITVDADALIFSGDATHGGGRESVDYFFDLLSTASHGKPVFMVMGNHDVVHPAFTENFQQAAKRYPNVHLNPGLHTIGDLDLLLVDNEYLSPAGNAVPYWRADCFPIPVLTTAKANELDGLLSTGSDRPAMMVIHCPTHVGPPIVVEAGHPILTGMKPYLQVVDRLLASHPRVRAVLSGHVHFACTAHFEHGRIHHSLGSFAEHPYQIRVLEGPANALRSHIVSPAMPQDLEWMQRKEN